MPLRYIKDEWLEEILTHCNDFGETETCNKYNINIETLHRYQRERRFRDTKQVKILLLDMETAFMEVRVWGLYKQRIPHTNIIADWHFLSWSAKFLFEANVQSDVLSPKEAVNKDDKRICESLWPLIDQADILIGHNCVGVNTPILKQDLTWVRAGDLKTGDDLVGFEEKARPGMPVRDERKKWIGVNGKNRKILPIKILDFTIESKPCLEVVFDNGDKVITTRDHYWLGMAERDANQRWYKTENIRIGQRFKRFFDVWGIDNSYEAGWLSGFISGEGTLKQSGCAFGVDFCQRPGSTWEQALEFCEKLNMPIAKERSPHPGGLGKQDTLYTGFIGGKFKIAENIGRLQIKRFIEKISWDKFGGLTRQGCRPSVVVAVNDVGIKDVAVFSTTSKTFFGAGYPMHNCNRFDLRKINTRFLLNGLKPPMPYLTIDTLKVAQRYFSFSSNRLDYLGKLFVNHGKIKTDYELWIRCAEGDKEALSLMERYNQEDVRLLEEVYLELRPWVKGHPNLALAIDAKEPCCPNCGGFEFEEGEGYYTTPQNRYISVRCKSCGSVNRKKESLITKEQRKSLIIPAAR